MEFHKVSESKKVHKENELLKLNVINSNKVPKKLGVFQIKTYRVPIPKCW